MTDEPSEERSRGEEFFWGFVETLVLLTVLGFVAGLFGVDSASTGFVLALALGGSIVFFVSMLLVRRRRK